MKAIKKFPVFNKNSNLTKIGNTIKTLNNFSIALLIYLIYFGTKASFLFFWK